MCGIFGYIGNGNCVPILLEGLKRLEYRGYDSAGMSFADGTLITKKHAGKVPELEHIIEKGVEASRGIAHTRWATHGVPNETNAHPHLSCCGNISVVHNGIIENYEALREELIKEGHTFVSETDTEVIPHLIEKFYKGGLEKAVKKTMQSLEGAYAIIALHKDEDKLVAAKKGSPLLLGIGDGEYFLSSDGTAIIKHTHNAVHLEDGDIVSVDKSGYRIFTLEKDTITRDALELNMTLEQIEKGGYKHFMQKEIFEQPKSLTETMRGRVKDDLIKLGGLHFEEPDFFKNINRIVIAACGTSYYSGLVGEHYFERIAGIPTCVEYASEFIYKNKILSNRDLFIVISQSGETKDTLEALKVAKRNGLRTFGVVNVVGSSIARETERGVYLHAGPEIGVASTKAFTSQITALYMISLALGQSEGLGTRVAALRNIPTQVERILEKHEHVKEMAEKYTDCNNFLYLGRGINYPVAMEGALKLKEISYVHAEGYPAAEMKHGPIALIDSNMPAVFIANKNCNYEKIITNMKEVESRKGRIITVATEGDDRITKYANDVIYVPETIEELTPILNVVPLQLLAYYLADYKGLNIDQPRNLAKSVTVE